MVQFYFLSVVMNLFAGLVLASESMEERLPVYAMFNTESLKSQLTFLLVGIITLVVGILKLLSVIEGDIPVVGDFVPALCGIFSGVTLLVMYYKEKATVENSLVNSLDSVLVNNKAVIGVVTAISGLVHFIMPRILFL